MKSSNSYSVIGKFIGVFALVAAGALAACNNGQGDTDGGSAVGNLGTGNLPVSDGGFGAKLVIDVEAPDDILQVGEVTGYFVTATDPQGLPLANRRVFCNSELGIAILEPAAGGVAFEHTDDGGKMSGKIAGITQGSYLFECRLEQGFNLVARKHLRVRGSGVASFPGAAGGTLGGGQIVPGFGGTPTPSPLTTTTPAASPTSTASLAKVSATLAAAEISLAGVYFEGNGAQETISKTASVSNVERCSASSEVANLVLTGTSAGVVEDVHFSIPGIVASGQQAAVKLATGSTTVTVGFTENTASGKVFSGTATSVPAGTYVVNFTATVRLADGNTQEVSGSTTVDFGSPSC